MKEKEGQGSAGGARQGDVFHGEFWKKNLGELRFRGAAGRPGRLLCGRLLPGTDLVDGIVAMARSFGIREAIFSCFGSLARARFSTGVRPSTSNPEDLVRVPPRIIEGPVELLCAQGKLGLPTEGDPVIHIHGALVTPDGVVTGGHFFSGGNPVFATMEVVIQEILGVRQLWEEDRESGVVLIESVPDQPKGVDHGI